MAEPERAFVNARLIDPAQSLDTLGNLLVRDGIIIALGPDIEIPYQLKYPLVQPMFQLGQYQMDPDLHFSQLYL